MAAARRTPEELVRLATTEGRTGGSLRVVAPYLEDAEAGLRWAAAFYLARVTGTARFELAEHAE